MGLGSALSSLRGDRVIAVDTSPGRGTLSDKLRLETAATVRDLLDERDQILRCADVRAFTTQAPSGLEVLASDRDPTVSVAFSDRDYEHVAQVLEHFYSVCITDCGTGLLHSAMAAVLRLAEGGRRDEPAPAQQGDGRCLPHPRGGSGRRLQLAQPGGSSDLSPDLPPARAAPGPDPGRGSGHPAVPLLLSRPPLVAAVRRRLYAGSAVQPTTAVSR